MAIPPVGPVGAAAARAAQEAGIKGWVDKLIEAIRAGDWKRAQTFAKTILQILRDEGAKIGRAVGKIKDISKLLRQAGATEKEIEAFEGAMEIAEKAAQTASTAAETTETVALGYWVLAGALFVFLVWALSPPAQSDELPESLRKKLPPNSGFDPLGDLEKACKKLVNHKRKECACSRKSHHAAQLHTHFPTGAGLTQIRYGGASLSRGSAASQMMAGQSGAAGNSGTAVHRPAVKPAGGGGRKPDPFAFPTRGGTPLPAPGKKGPEGPTLPDARPQGVCLWPLCEKIASSFG